MFDDIEDDRPVWVPCPCGNFMCLLHDQHAHDCPCPPVDEMDHDPYAEGSHSDKVML
jgi:hypothetical protein